MTIKTAAGIIPNTRNQVFMYQLAGRPDFVCSITDPLQPLPQRMLIAQERWDFYCHRWNLTQKEAAR